MQTKDPEKFIDDLIPAIELTQWRAGRVLDAADVQMLGRFLREIDDRENRQIDLWEEAEKSVLMQLGGKELVESFECDSAARVQDAVQNALAKYYARLAEKRAKAS